jgi:Flp pilus assembly protein CpaB
VGSAALAGLLAKGYIGKKPVTEVVEVSKVEIAEVLVASRDLPCDRLRGRRLANGRRVTSPSR